MYKVSVTTLEKFRRFLKGASLFDTEEALIESIKGEFIGNDKTKTGEAFHKLIEGDFSSEEYGFLANGIFFTPEQAKPAFRYKRLHPHMVHEVSVRKIYDLGNLSVLVTGRTDGVEGLEVRDTKCKFSDPDFQEYMDSCQWRYYLDILQLDVFHYDVFEVVGFEALPLVSSVVFRDCQSLQVNRYINLQDDCIALLKQFMQYIQDRNFYHLLKQVNETSIL